jgi:ubiquitin thioesterase OTU1
MPPAAYARNILDPNTWGGAIEIDLLAFVFQTEICVLDMTSKRPQIFGQGNNFTIRSYVVYTGNHYDAGGIGSSLGAGQLQKTFASKDERPMLLAQDYLHGRVKEAKEAAK